MLTAEAKIGTRDGPGIFLVISTSFLKEFRQCEFWGRLHWLLVLHLISGECFQVIHFKQSSCARWWFPF